MDQLPSVVSQTHPITGKATSSSEAGPWLMDNPIRDYAWGSTTTLALLQGREPSGHPEAELWMGAHDAAPSLVADRHGSQRSLVRAIDADPLGTLGPDCLARFGARLPFLMKVLAVQGPLSIQVHPSAEQAVRGFAREEAAGIRLGAPDRSYADSGPKPELLYAVTPFEGLCGLRPKDEARHLLGLLGAPRLAPILARMATGGERASIEAVALLAAWPQDLRAAMVREVLAAAHVVLAGLAAGRPEPDDDAVGALRWVIRLGRHFPNDPLIVAPLLLRLLHLEPGETLFTPAGVPHAHLVGTVVEIMASSDNVVRAGLTSKHVDAKELLALLSIAAEPATDIPQHRLSPREVAWRPPIAEFQLTRLEVGMNQPERECVEISGAVQGPQVLLCMAGDVEVRSGAAAGLAVRAGQSVFLPAAMAGAPVQLIGRGEIFRAAIASRT